MIMNREARLALALFALLAPCIVASYRYSLAPSALWLASTLLALALALGFVVWSARVFARRWLGLAWTLAWAEVLALYQAARLVSFYFQGESFNERFLFHFNFNAIFEGGAAYWPLMLAVIALLLAVAAAVLLLFPRARRPLGQRPWLPAAALLAGVLLEPGARGLAGQALQGAAPAPVSAAGIAWRELGLDPAALSPRIEARGAGKNLLLIYLEGLEQVYTEAAIFPGLTPNLKRLAAQGLAFDGLAQTEGTSWTVGGLLASQCGTPLIHDFGAGGNDILQNGFLNRAACLGDILDAAGYRQVFMGGASTRFAGKGSFLTAHGYGEVKGREELAPLLEDASYLSGWGLYDDSLFALAREEFKELAAGPAPFNLTLLTLDTHHPDGHASRSCPPYAGIDNSILHAVHCTDYLLGRFLDDLAAHPAWDDTVVVLLSDHLAMRNAAQGLYPRGYERRLLFTVLGAGAGEIALPGSHMDVAPTLLDLLGVEGGVGFLAGASLLDREGRAVVDVEAPARLEAIRFANTALLSGASAGLCAASPLLAAEDDALRLGGRQAVLSVSGNPLGLPVLESSHALLALLNPDGGIRSLSTVFLENLGHALYQARDEIVLLVGPAGALSRQGRAAGLPAGGVAALLGNPRGAMTFLGGAPQAAQLRVEVADCPSLLAAARPGEGESDDAALLAGICAPEDGSAGSLEEGVLSLPRVVIENGWYEARLRGSVATGFDVVERRFLEPLQGASATPGCHAWYANSELIVPRVAGPVGTRALTLRLLPGSTTRFEDVRSFPLP